MTWNNLLRQHKMPETTCLEIDTNLIRQYGKTTTRSDDKYYLAIVTRDKKGRIIYNFVLEDEELLEILVTPSYSSAKEFAERIKRVFPKLEIVIVNRHCTTEWTFVKEDE